MHHANSRLEVAPGRSGSVGRSLVGVLLTDSNRSPCFQRRKLLDPLSCTPAGGRQEGPLRALGTQQLCSARRSGTFYPPVFSLFRPLDSLFPVLVMGSHHSG